MRVLVLTQVVVYPADAGPKVKTLQVLQYLAARHTVTYCTFTRSDTDIHNAEKLGKHCHRVATVGIKRSRLQDARFLFESLATDDSFILRRDESKAMHAMIRKLIQEEQIDVLHVDQLNMMRFVPPDWNGKVVLDEHNAVWQVVERLKKGTNNLILRMFLSREVQKIRTLEGAACHRADVVLAVSKHDKQALCDVAGPSARVEIVPITVDADSFESIWSKRAPQTHRLFTIGTMFWPPNSEGVAWWLRKGFKYLQSLCPDAVYDIVGARPPRKLHRIARSWKHVHLHGYVADTVPFWTQVTALAVPILSGGGVRVKILEAMAMGVPIISTTVGCEGLDVASGKHLLVADTPETFAQACATVLQDSVLAQSLAQNARQLILERYDAKVALQVLDHVYQQL